ncbi:C-X-C chemokine receptor type 3-like [Hypanus sabinus]|uniref:C-X-C chemokine receptor type 3-like n=1 Tax=Hypanus sabinus TaxID=79690 RepID=UPI0028C3E978|nr:C-X-C chemokine receptor type 3-like [Hypanus sabinus]
MAGYYYTVYDGYGGYDGYEGSSVDLDILDNLTLYGGIEWPNVSTDSCQNAAPCDFEPCGGGGGGGTDQRAQQVLLLVLYLLVFLVGFVSNVLVLAVVLLERGRRHHRQYSMDVFMAHLAFADLILATSLLFWAVDQARGWIFGLAACKLVGALYNLSFYSSLYALVCISFERHLAVVRTTPARPRHLGHSTGALLASLAVWLTCLLLTVPDFVYLRLMPSNGSSPQCVHHYGKQGNRAWVVGLRCFFHVTGFLLPLTIMAYCYFSIGRTILRANGARRRREWRALRVIAAVVLAFLLCWTPYNVTLLLETVHRLGALGRDCAFERRMDLADTLTGCLANLHCCLNPFLYAFVGIRFRGQLRDMLSRWGLWNRAGTWRRDWNDRSRNSTVSSGSELGNTSKSWI